MKSLLSFILVLVISFNSTASAPKVRHISLLTDQIAIVKTALGIATIIQVPDRPNSLVVGDTEAFKVEYLDQAITIKPMRNGARSNLYIYTDYHRFNVQLIAGSEASADYVVYLDIPKEKKNGKDAKPTLHWKPYRSRLKNESISLAVTRIGRVKDDLLVIEFKLTGTRREAIDPKWIWLTQNGETKPIHRLALSRLEVVPKEPVEGTIQVLRADISDSKPLKLELRRKQTSFLTIPEVRSWK